MLSDNISRKQIQHPSYECDPTKLLNDIYDALNESKKKSEIFVKNPNLDNSKQSCATNRKTICLLYLARFSYQVVHLQKQTRTIL